MKQGFWVLGLFGIIGVAATVGSIFVFVNQKQFVAEALRAPGVVIDLIEQRDDDGSTYAPEVAYTTAAGENITFISGTSANPAAFSRNEQVEVLYRAEEPEQAKINAFSTLYTFPLIMGGMGMIFALVGIIPGSIMLRRKKQIEYLKQFGMRISSTVTQIEYRKNYKVNNQSPYRIWAEGTDPRSGSVTTFKSDNIWFNPEQYIHTGDIVDVLVHPQKIHLHYMETPFLDQTNIP